MQAFGSGGPPGHASEQAQGLYSTPSQTMPINQPTAHGQPCFGSATPNALNVYPRSASGTPNQLHRNPRQEALPQSQSANDEEAGGSSPLQRSPAPDPSGSDHPIFLPCTAQFGCDPPYACPPPNLPQRTAPAASPQALPPSSGGSGAFTQCGTRRSSSVGAFSRELQSVTACSSSSSSSISAFNRPLAQQEPCRSFVLRLAATPPPGHMVGKANVLPRGQSLPPLSPWHSSSQPMPTFAPAQMPVEQIQQQVNIHNASPGAFPRQLGGPLLAQGRALTVFLPKLINGVAVLVKEGNNIWRATNAHLRSNSRALAYRKTKIMDDKVNGPLARLLFGWALDGVDEGDGWVRCQVLAEAPFSAVDVTFHAGAPLGLELTGGHVTGVHPGLRGDSAGVKIGWVIARVNGGAFSPDRLRACSAGSHPFVVTFHGQVGSIQDRSTSPWRQGRMPNSTPQADASGQPAIHGRPRSSSPWCKGCAPNPPQWTSPQQSVFCGWTSHSVSECGQNALPRSQSVPLLGASQSAVDNFQSRRCPTSLVSPGKDINISALSEESKSTTGVDAPRLRSALANIMSVLKSEPANGSLDISNTDTSKSSLVDVPIAHERRSVLGHPENISELPSTLEEASDIPCVSEPANDVPAVSKEIQWLDEQIVAVRERRALCERQGQRIGAVRRAASAEKGRDPRRSQRRRIIALEEGLTKACGLLEAARCEQVSHEKHVAKLETKCSRLEMVHDAQNDNKHHATKLEEILQETEAARKDIEERAAELEEMLNGRMQDAKEAQGRSEDVIAVLKDQVARLEAGSMILSTGEQGYCEEQAAALEQLLEESRSTQRDSEMRAVDLEASLNFRAKVDKDVQEHSEGNISELRGKVVRLEVVAQDIQEAPSTPPNSTASGEALPSPQRGLKTEAVFMFPDKAEKGQRHYAAHAEQKSRAGPSAPKKTSEDTRSKLPSSNMRIRIDVQHQNTGQVSQQSPTRVVLKCDSRESFLDISNIPAPYMQVLENIETRGWESVRFERGYTLLHWAASKGHGDLCKYLLGLKGDPHALDAQMRSPLDVAKARGHANIVDILEGTSEMVPILL